MNDEQAPNDVKANELSGSISPAGDAPRMPLSMIVVYEDLPARLRMQKVFWSLMQEVAEDYEFGCFWFGFDDLKNTRVATQAGAAAAAADLILFSVNGDTVPPESVKSWVETWIESKAAQDAALAALLNKAKSPDKQRMPIWKYLNQIAQRAGMSFLPEIMAPDQLCGQAS